MNATGVAGWSLGRRTAVRVEGCGALQMNPQQSIPVFGGFSTKAALSFSGKTCLEKVGLDGGVADEVASFGGWKDLTPEIDELMPSCRCNLSKHSFFSLSWILDTYPLMFFHQIIHFPHLHRSGDFDSPDSKRPFFPGFQGPENRVEAMSG